MVKSAQLVVALAAAHLQITDRSAARGTDEPNAPGGQYGVIVGDPLFNATQKAIPGVTAYAVPYPASAACDSESIGVADIINHLTSMSQACSGQKFVLVGYSQGADVVHKAAQQLSTSLYPSIIALVQYGDPNNRGVGQVNPLGGSTFSALPAILANRTCENCRSTDPVCTNNATDFTGHLLYYDPVYINNSVSYIQQQLATDGNAGPDDTLDANPGNQTDANISALLALGSFLGQTGTRPACPSTSGSATGTASMVATMTGMGNGTASSSGSGGSSSGTGAMPTSTVEASPGGAASVRISLGAGIAGLVVALGMLCA
ncbi:hypothetical protein ANO11243_076330 [Dothideomycetidae sp. 11243]|nr:hypothetical protein ANO11243_076330 [fungal sp. No.11243]